jgi:periplasmic protein TonB
MSPHVDILDDRERLARPFWTSVALHVSVAAALLMAGRIGRFSRVPFMGDPNGGGIGSVAVNVAHSVPLPARGGPVNPVANDTESAVPTPPPKTRAQAKAQEPDETAIPLRSRNAAKRRAERASSESNKWREQQKDLPNQVYSPAGQAVSSPMYNLPGGGGVGVGNSSPFGTQFGWYATLLRDQVARNWRTADITRTSVPVVVTFTILKDGSVPAQSVKVTGTSGNRALDFSAQRAVLDASPFPQLPAGFPRGDAAIELRFELRR